MDVRTAIETGNIVALHELLAADPALANRHIAWGKRGEIRTHPLHFVADRLFDGTLDRSREVEIGIPLLDALIDAGADVNHFSRDGSGDEPKCETPLNGAASLGSQDLGIRLIDAGARTNTINLLGETALHWASFLGLDRLVDYILRVEDPHHLSLHVRDSQWSSTPLGWAMHGWSQPMPGSAGRYGEVVTALVEAGAEVESKWLADDRIQADPEKRAALRL